MLVKILKIPFAFLSLLTIPLVAMQFTDEVRWSVGDFVVMGLLLLGLGLSIELVLKKTKYTQKRWTYLKTSDFSFKIYIFNSPWAGSAGLTII